MARSKYASRNIWSTSNVDYDDVIDKYGNLQLSKKQLMQYFKGKFSEFECRAKRYDKAVKFRQLQIADRNLEVVYICGQSGSGKISLWANNQQMAPLVSGKTLFSPTRILQRQYSRGNSNPY